MRAIGRTLTLLLFVVLAATGSGCASMRRLQVDRDLRPCDDAYIQTADGWRLGVRRYRPEMPDPGKDPVVLCHGLGLNGTFWTITDDHLPAQLAARGYEVFVVDMRGSGASHRVGTIGWVNSGLRQTPLRELRSDRWTMDDEAFYDAPAIIDYVLRETGKRRVNWIGHSLGGMLMYPFLEHSPHASKVSSFVSMGSPACIAESPERDRMLRANRSLRMLLRGVSTGRIARPMMVARPPGLEQIDRFYFTAENVDRRTISRFYGITLEDPGPGALHQLDRYLASGRLQSADGTVDYFEDLDTITVPTLFVAGDGDILADLYSKWQTYEAIGSRDKTFLRFGRKQGHYADYGHCDLVWSRHAPNEIFPELIDWLDRRQPGVRPSEQRPTAPAPSPQQ